VNDRDAETSLASRLAELPQGVERHLGGHPPEALEGVSLVVVSPGVPWDLPLLEQARSRGIEVLAEVELAFRHLPGVPLLGVTGSNGKTTVTALAGEVLRAAGVSAAVGGNIGTPASLHAVEGRWDALVWELSSFQLEGCDTLRPRVGVLLNLSPDHLDRHGGLESYLAAKALIFRRQTAEDWAVLNADDPALVGLRPRGRVEWFSLDNRRVAAHLGEDALVLDGTPLLRRSQLGLLGDHNVANALAAALATARLGAPREAIASALAAFKGLPHRHQVVAEAGGVRYVDDSKGTNIGATAAGLRGYVPGSVHLILGGRGKGQDCEAADEIGAALEGVVAVEACGTLERAVGRAAAHARSGDTVLLSPACASFDQFRDYAHRGDEFARLARSLAGGR
ncbi:MAG: UDP-N-acetylmuramoyl-L-alanine--D-glutamate ligase, partial [Acidobacteriota bacterium]